jgi:hypothetical protein
VRPVQTVEVSGHKTRGGREMTCTGRWATLIAARLMVRDQSRSPVAGRPLRHPRADFSVAPPFAACCATGTEVAELLLARLVPSNGNG